MAEFSPELFDVICERIADGESLRAICSGDDMPNKSSVFRWIDRDDKARDQYTRAREAQADTLFDDCLDISDNGNEDDPQRARLRIDTRKWMAGKLRPKKYGERQQVDHTSSDNSMTPTVIERVIVSPTDTD